MIVDYSVIMGRKGEKESFCFFVVKVMGKSVVFNNEGEIIRFCIVVFFD